MSSKTLMLAAALAGLAIGSAQAQTDTKPAEAKKADAPVAAVVAEEVLCYGVNECGGKSVCAGKVDTCSGKTGCETKTQCAGHNSCKGKGVVKMDKQACLDKKGKVAANAH